MTETVDPAQESTPNDDETRDRSAGSDSVLVKPQDTSPGSSEKRIRPSRTDWDAFFAAKKRNPLDVRKLVFQLHESGAYGEVVAVIRAALRHGQRQPWMYEVLALTLKISGAPQAAVERALMSQVDFSAADAPNLMLSAAYLTRFGAKEPALRLYRQAADLAPQRPEPYVMGLELARQLKDDEALAWAVRGIFATAWGLKHHLYHKQAANAVAERAKELRAAGKKQMVANLEAVLAEARQVDLDFRLQWSGSGDLDLLVTEPSGEICSFANERTTGGGVLVHDGYGPKQENCFEHYVCGAGFPGIYRVRVRYARGKIVGKRAKLIITQYKGTDRESRREIIVPITDEGEVIRVALIRGRRTELLEDPDLEKPAAEAKPKQAAHRPDSGERLAALRFGNSVHPQIGGGLGIGRRPIVGVGAVGYQPIITVIPSGAQLTTAALVSPDRRYVRLSLNASFTQLFNVMTFTFTRP